MGVRQVSVVAGVALAALTLGAGSRSADRSTADRPDDIAGPQVHVVYVVPSDGVDRGLDANGTIAASVANWEGWLRGQTGGHGLRLDTAGGTPDVTFFRLPETDAQVSATGAQVRDTIEHDLITAGLTKPGKLYAVYYDGTSTYACGGGAWPPALPGIVAAVYLPATYWNTSGIPCYDPSKSLAGLQLMDYAVLHELLHTIGVVPSCAPHFTAAGHVSDSPTDLMYAGGAPWAPSILDVGRDDYFGAHVAGCADLSVSPYLEGNTFDVHLAVVLHPGAHGTVTSAPAGIRCPGTCTAAFAGGSHVILTATAGRLSRFVSWGGAACAGRIRVCSFSLADDGSAVAAFALLPRCKPGQRSTSAHRCRR